MIIKAKNGGRIKMTEEQDNVEEGQEEEETEEKTKPWACGSEKQAPPWALKN